MRQRRIRKNPIIGRVPLRSPRSKLVAQYKEPLARLRQLGIDPLPGVPLDRIRDIADIPPEKRRSIVRLYENYDYLFSRPHVVADFSLPEAKIRREYGDWKERVVQTLKHDGYTAAV